MYGKKVKNAGQVNVPRSTEGFKVYSALCAPDDEMGQILKGFGASHKVTDKLQFQSKLINTRRCACPCAKESLSS